MPLELATDDLNKLVDGGPSPVVDIVFVHGLRGHPQKTWEAVDPQDPDEKVFWPKELLPETVKNARIFSYGYITEFATFYPILTKPIPHTNIDHHSMGLIRKLGDFRKNTESSTRPIIFIAHSLGGLVVANALARKYDDKSQDQDVVNHTYGTVFLGTPFKGSDKAPWAQVARRLSDWVGGDTNDQTIQDLDKRSTKLQQISINFHLLVQSRANSKELKPIQVACFFEEIKTKKSLLKVKKDLGLIVTAASATLDRYPETGINADHVGMCRFHSVDQAGYKLVTGKIKEIIDNFKKSSAELTSEGETVINIGDVNMGNNNLNVGGYFQAVVIGTTKDAVKQEIHNTFGGAEIAQLMAGRMNNQNA